MQTLKNLFVLLSISCITINCYADRIYVITGLGYNSAETQFTDAITANGHTVVINSTNFNSLPPNFTTTCNDPIDGFDWLCLFGNQDYTILTPQIQQYLDEGGKVYMQYEVGCCTISTQSVASILSSVTGLSITPNSNSSIAGSSGVTSPGYEAIDLDCCFSAVGNAYKGLDGLPVENQYQATATLNGNPVIETCLNFGFTFNTTDFVGAANNGGIIGFGDYNMWYDADEPWSNGGSTPPNMAIIDYIFPNENSPCYAFAPGCLTSSIENPNTFDVDLGNDTTLCEGATLTLNGFNTNSTYVWQDGSTDSFFDVVNPGLYWVEVSNSCETATDSILIDYVPSPTVDLGSDLSLCNGDTIILDASSPNATYLWQDNSIDPTLTVTESGTYWVTVTADVCSAMDTVVISIGTPPIIDIGSDVILCQNESITLDATTLNAVYNWQDNSNAATFDVNETGTYWVEVTVDNCSSIDSILVDYHPSTDLGSDTILCAGDFIVLDATTPNATYVWQDNSTSATLIADEPGIYWAQVNTPDCSFIDSITVIAGLVPGDEDFSFLLCEGEYIAESLIPAGLQVQIDGQDITDILFTDSAEVQIQISNEQCSIEDTIFVAVIDAVTIDLGDNLRICIGTSVTLNSGISNHIITWQDGTEGEDFLITEPGLYSASLEYACGIISDSLRVEHIDCDTTIFIPNAFTPDGDGVNDLFHIEGHGISYFKLSIYDRWGHLIFLSEDLDLPWNGGAPGSDYFVPDGTYSYELEYSFGIDGQKKTTADHRKFGFITILR